MEVSAHSLPCPPRPASVRSGRSRSSRSPSSWSCSTTSSSRPPSPRSAATSAAGCRRMFVIGLGIFTLASAGAALAPSTGALIAARALQGAGAAIVTPLTLTLLSTAFPPEKRGLAIGAWSGISGLGVALGPLVGGAVVDGISWHWIFWLNVPTGLVLAPLAYRRLSESHGPRERLDPVGLVLAAAGLLGVVW